MFCKALQTETNQVRDRASLFTWIPRTWQSESLLEG